MSLLGVSFLVVLAGVLAAIYLVVALARRRD
jgi:hypothetical protein